MARKELVVQFSPGEGPFDTPTWVTLTAGGPHGNRVRSAEWQWGRERDDQAYPSGSATIELYNHDRLFDPDNAAGTYTGQLLPRVPFRLRTDAGEDLFYGFVEDGWEQTYSHPEDGYCTIQLVDMLAVIEGYTLPGVFEHTVLSYDPVGFWKLDQADAERVADLSGNGHDGTVNGDGIDLGDRVIAAGHAPAARFDVEIDAVSERSTYGFVDLGRSPLITGNMASALVMVTFQARSVGDLNWRTVFAHGNGNVANVTGVEMHVDTDGRLVKAYATNGSGGAGRTSVSVVDGKPHLAFGGGNGVALDSASLVVNSTGLSLGTINGAAIGGGRGIQDIDHFDGWIGAVALFASSLTVGTTERQAILDAYSLLDGLRSDQHIGWALDRIGVPAGLRNLDQGRSIMGAARTAGADALEFIRQVAATENGAVYVDHHDGGKIRFVERYAPWLATRSTASQATFSDDPANTTAVRVEPDSLVVEANGIRSIINQATVTWTGGKETAQDDTSVTAYGPRGRTIDTVAENPNQALSLAQWVAHLRAQPATHIRGFGINPAGAEAGFPAAVGLRPFDLVTYRSQPGAAGTVVTRNLLIEGGRHRVEGMEWETAFSTSKTPADLVDLFILGTSELGGPDVLAY